MTNPLSYIVSDFARYYHAYDNKHTKKSFPIKAAIFFHNPNMWFLILYRIESYFFSHSFFIFKIIGTLLYPLYFYISYFIFDVHIHPQVRIGKGFYMHYRGIIITASVKAGENLSVIGPITVGTDLMENQGAIIGNNVTICAGAKVIGSVSIGDNVIIGANAVVVKDVPASAIVGGVPAQILKN